MKETQEIKPADFTSVYKDIAENLGCDVAIALHSMFQGTQVTFPRKLYTQEYIMQQVDGETAAGSVKNIAVKFGYTERRLRQIIKENKGE